MRRQLIPVVVAFLLGAIIAGYSVALWMSPARGLVVELPDLEGEDWHKALLVGKPDHSHVDLMVCPPDGRLGPIPFTAKDEVMFRTVKVGRYVSLALHHENTPWGSEGSWSYSQWALLGWKNEAGE